MEYAIELAKHYEQCRLESYQDTGGVWTIGYGHTAGVTKNSKLHSKHQAEQLLREDMQGRMLELDNLDIRFHNIYQRDAILDLIFNVGMANFSRSKTCALLKKRMKPFSAYEETDKMFWEWLDFNKVNGKILDGLLKRRLSEIILFRDRKLILF